MATGRTWPEDRLGGDPFPRKPAGVPAFCLAICLATAWAAPGTAAEPDRLAVAATVGGRPVTVGEVERTLRRATGDRPVGARALPVLQAQALGEIVARRLVLAYAERTGEAASEDEIQSRLASLQSRLKASGRTLEDWLAERSLVRSELRPRVAYECVWQRLWTRYATDARVEACFAAHRREFDGTKLSVSHILLRGEGEGDAAEVARLVARAQSIRRRIVSGETTFEEAARQRSAGPSAARGGRLGWIGRDGPMAESFARAAYQLDVGQISQPVVSPFGVHLIRCDEIAPGTRSLDEVREKVEKRLARQLLEKIAARQARDSPVVYTGRLPYFRPGSGELVEP